VYKRHSEVSDSHVKPRPSFLHQVFSQILSMGASIGRKIFPQLKLSLCRSLVSAALLVGLCEASLAQGDADLEAPGLPAFGSTLASGSTLFQNVRIFDGKSAALSAPSNVLVKDNTIARISVSPITIETNADVRVIPADGRVLMPGLMGVPCSGSSARSTKVS
jgi:hypothetical protein